jgi:hypothetical protein
MKCITGEVMRIVQRALNTIREYTRKTKELDTAIREREKKADLHIAAAEKTAAEQVSKYKATFEKLRNKVLGIKTV